MFAFPKKLFPIPKNVIIFSFVPFMIPKNVHILTKSSSSFEIITNFLMTSFLKIFTFSNKKMRSEFFKNNFAAYGSYRLGYLFGHPNPS